MNGLIHFTSQLFLVFLGSCTGSQSTNNKEVNEPIKTHNAAKKESQLLAKDSISQSTDGSFWYYIPTLKQAMPNGCFIILDPHANAKLPVTLYKNLAQSYGFVLVASAKIQNGMPFSQTRILANQLIETVTKSFDNGLNINLLGLSGGARVAFDVATEENGNVDVVYSGAAGNSNNFPFRMLGFAGQSDMNYSELLAFDQSLPKDGHHFLIETNEKHAWPSVENMELAFLWALSKNHLRPKFYFEKKEKRYQSAKRQTFLWQKVNQLELIQLLCKFDSTSFLGQSDLNRIKSTQPYLENNRKRQDILKEEIKAREYYSTAFFEKNLTWWKIEVQKLRMKSQPEIEAMNQRLLGYFSLAAYSIVHNAVKANDFEGALRILDIYELADPENSEYAFMRAVCLCHQSRQEDALIHLTKAYRLGFQDLSRLNSETCFQSYSNNPLFEKLKFSISKNAQ